MTDAEHWLLKNFEALDLPANATAWLLDLWKITQVLDDLADDDRVSPAEVQEAVWKILVTFPANPFFIANAAALQPALATAVLKWEAANRAEKTGQADEKSYMWRAGYYDIVVLVLLLCQGYDSAMAKASSVMALYGEKFSDYRAEFSNG